MHLAIDRGNTRTKWGLFKKGRLVKTSTLDRFNLPTLRKLISGSKASYVILSSTKHLSKSMSRYFDQHDKYLIMSSDLQLPFHNTYESPSTLGRDRLAAVAGAWSLFPQENNLVIDVGSCITYDLITKTGEYIGGNISPGVYMRLQAMHKFTDQLPQVDPPARYMEMGTDTRTALQVGACLGAELEISGFIGKYKRKFRNLNVLLTGGGAHFFVNRLKTKIFASPHLVLQGLNEILSYNAQKHT